MKGYVVVSQWHSRIRKLDELLDPRQHVGDAQAVDSLLGWRPPEVHEAQPTIHTGEVCLRIEDDDSLTLVAANYDSSG